MSNAKSRKSKEPAQNYSVAATLSSLWGGGRNDRYKKKRTKDDEEESGAEEEGGDLSEEDFLSTDEAEERENAAKTNEAGLPQGAIDMPKPPDYIIELYFQLIQTVQRL